MNQGLVPSVGFALPHQELHADDRIGDDQEDDGQIEREIAGGHHIENLPSHVLQETFVIQFYFI